MLPQSIVTQILSKYIIQQPSKWRGQAFAPSNIALCKYWGKRDIELNLPVTSSLSIALGQQGAHCTVSLQRAAQHELRLNAVAIAAETVFGQRLRNFLDLLRPNNSCHFNVAIELNVPFAAGLASSASIFAAVVLAINDLFNWHLPERELSILARLGSGSACRSIFPGFVEWHAGVAADGMDSYAEPLPYTWPDLKVGLLLASSQPKALASGAAMARTVATAPFYKAWPAKVTQDLVALKLALKTHDFHLLGQTAESNALHMHALMLSSWPPVVYSVPLTLEWMQQVWQQRNAGLAVYFTQDAGPNLKLLFLKHDEPQLKAHFPELTVMV